MYIYIYIYIYIMYIYIMYVCIYIYIYTYTYTYIYTYLCMIPEGTPTEELAIMKHVFVMIRQTATMSFLHVGLFYVVVYYVCLFLAICLHVGAATMSFLFAYMCHYCIASMRVYSCVCVLSCVVFEDCHNVLRAGEGTAG